MILNLYTFSTQGNYYNFSDSISAIQMHFIWVAFIFQIYQPSHRLQKINGYVFFVLVSMSRQCYIVCGANDAASMLDKLYFKVSQFYPELPKVYVAIAYWLSVCPSVRLERERKRERERERVIFLLMPQFLFHFFRDSIPMFTQPKEVYRARLSGWGEFIHQ